MNTVSFNEVKEFVVNELWDLKTPITNTTALAHDFEIAGLDGAELMEKFGVEFKVSLEGFEWVKYFGPEGAGNPIDLIWYAYKRFIQKIPARELVDLPELTIGHLVKCANNKKWSSPSGSA